MTTTTMTIDYNNDKFYGNSATSKLIVQLIFHMNLWIRCTEGNSFSNIRGSACVKSPVITTIITTSIIVMPCFI